MLAVRWGSVLGYLDRHQVPDTRAMTGLVAGMQSWSPLAVVDVIGLATRRQSWGGAGAMLPVDN